MMTLLDDDEGDSRLVVWLQLDASLPDCGQLVLTKISISTSISADKL